MKTDAQILADISEKFKFEPSLDAKHIDVSVENKIVSLHGKVNSYAEKLAAERAARSVEGVRGIADELRVDLLAKYQRDDKDIAKAAANALLWDITVPENIQVTVENGNLTLTGDVSMGYQRYNADKAVRRLIGIKSVNNQIKIKPAISSGQVKDKIISEFKRNAAIDAQNIQVEINGDKVTLKGKLKSWAEVKEATRAAWSVPGIALLENHLVVE